MIVAASCGGIFEIMLSITGGQGLALAARDKEMTCRSDGGSDCKASEFGTAILKFKNEEELLTIQDQMKNLSSLNQRLYFSKTYFSIYESLFPFAIYIITFLNVAKK